MIDYNKPALGVLFTNGAKAKGTVPFKRKYSRSHAILSNKVSKQGMNAFFAHHKEFSNGKLKRAWCRYNNRWKIVKDVRVDVIYSRFAASIYKNNKKNKAAEKFKWEIAKQVPMINHPLIDEFCWDKRIVPDVFPEHCPKTFVVNTKIGLKLVLGKIKSDLVVIKPRYGTLGKDVIITNKKDLPDKIGKNTLVQEFIDTSKGIKGITKGLHDMRLIMINGEVDHAHIRIPKKGTLTANVALGGEKIFIPNRLIPDKAIKISKRIDKLFKDFYPRIFSVDLMFDAKGKPYIVECNSQPMIDKYAFGKYAKVSFYNRVIDALKKGIKVKVVQRV